tara:strand:+ start:220 stop:1146 length:927 start_codon:yes stop_codon:yes gene_type:complete
MKLIKIFIFVIFYSTFLFNELVSKENKILFKINNEIITSVDILNEIKYLSIINEEFKNSDNNLKLKVAKNSLIREKIKNIELQNYRKSIKINESFLENIIKNYFANLNIKSSDEFELFFKQKKLQPSLVKSKIITEIMWNQLIYNKFKEKVKINEDQIKKNISNKKKQKQYLLSEILVDADNSKKFKEKLELIIRTIEENSFSKAALTYSTSETSKNGGKLGWIKENVLNEKIKKNLNDIKKGNYTKPITVPGGLLILNVEDIREIEIKIDINKEIKNIIEKQTNDQLNRYSNIYFNKIKKNTQINEI